MKVFFHKRYYWVSIIMILASPLFGQNQKSKNLKVKPSSKININLELIVAGAILQSDSFKQIQTGLLTKENMLMRSEQSYDWNLNGKAIYFDSMKETSGGMFNPKRAKFQNITGGVTKKLQSGTSLTAQLQYQNNLNEYASNSGAANAFSNFTPNGKYQESTASVILKQPLLRDQMGEAGKSQLIAGQSFGKAIEKSTEMQTEGFVLNIVNQYYTAWSAQVSINAAQERLDRQNELLRVTNIKYRRGTAEKSELLQMESSKIQTENQLLEANKFLQDIWVGLVNMVKLPEDFYKIEMNQLSIAGDNLLEQSIKSCSEFDANDFRKKIENKAQFQMYSYQKEMAVANLESKMSLGKPDLYVEAGLHGNGIEKNFTDSFTEALTMQHPQFSVALGLQMFIDNPGAKADYLESLKTEKDSEIAQQLFYNESEVKWRTNCQQLEILSRKKAALTQMISKQKERAILEKERFELGQVDIFNVIQAENDVVGAEFELHSTVRSMYLASWNIIALNNEIQGIVKDWVAAFEKNYQNATKNL